MTAYQKIKRNDSCALAVRQISSLSGAANGKKLYVTRMIDMPAIKQCTRRMTKPKFLTIGILYINNVDTVLADGTIKPVHCVGFIYNAGAQQLQRGKLTRFNTSAISLDDGSEDDEWVPVPDGACVVGWLLPPATSHQSDPRNIYVLVDDCGWPMPPLVISNDQSLVFLLLVFFLRSLKLARTSQKAMSRMK